MTTRNEHYRAPIKPYTSETKAVPQEIQTFRERIEDQSKVSLCSDFITTIERLAVCNDKSEDEVYTLWLKYSNDCRNSDQSAIVSEFVEWNKLATEKPKAVPQTAHTYRVERHGRTWGIRDCYNNLIASEIGTVETATELASAPELLAACEAVINEGSDYLNSSTLEMIRLAIARARGGE